MNHYQIPYHLNLWFVFIVGIIAYGAVILLPKRFPLELMLLYLMMGFTIVVYFDHTLGTPPFDVYDVNSASKFQWLDLITYIMFGPFSYLFIYFMDYLKLKGFPVIIYIVFWTIIAIISEIIALKCGVYHYKKGYELGYSISIYLVTETLTVFLYMFTKFRVDKYQNK